MNGHVVVIHRWRAPYALYEEYIDHTKHRVSYVTSTIGRAGVPLQAARIEIVAATDSLLEVRPAVARLVSEFGRPEAIVALKEDDLLTAAQLTAEYDLPGLRPADLEVFRDKIFMAEAVRAAGLEQPLFAPAEGPADIAAFGRRHGWPVVVKPRRGSSSEGVHVVHEGGIDPSWRSGPDGSIVQSFVDGVLCHVDGVFDGHRIGPLRVSRYIGSPLAFRTGAWVGSVEIDDSATLAIVASYSQGVLTALTNAPTVFHLEVFLRGDGTADPVCVFVEIAARAGGAEIPFLWREVHGYDLIGQAFRFALGSFGGDDLTSIPGSPQGSERYAGLLLVPTPAKRPCRITAVQPVMGTMLAPPELYAEEIPAIGDVIPAAPAFYEHVGGRFRFRGRSTVDVEAAIKYVAQQFLMAGNCIAEGTYVTQDEEELT